MGNSGWGSSALAALDDSHRSPEMEGRLPEQEELHVTSVTSYFCNLRRLLSQWHAW